MHQDVCTRLVFLDEPDYPIEVCLLGLIYFFFNLPVCVRYYSVKNKRESDSDSAPWTVTNRAQFYIVSRFYALLVYICMPGVNFFFFNNLSFSFCVNEFPLLRSFQCCLRSENAVWFFCHPPQFHYRHALAFFYFFFVLLLLLFASCTFTL